ncbi:HDIG domain-containing protein [Phormidium tenue FACHB-886]|nr:HDIG domain-containing protein [Phormidium tenue FACHB-886]
MNFFQALTHRLIQWRRTYFPANMPSYRLQKVLKQLPAHLKHLRAALKRAAQAFVKPEHLVIRRNLMLRRRAHPNQRVQTRIFFVIATLLLTSAIGYRFYNEPQLGVGVIAPQTLEASASARVIDTRTTEDNRKAAKLAAVPVLMIDQSANQDIYESLERQLNRGNLLRREAGSFPFVETSLLSTETQRYLRQAEEWEWRTAIAAAEGASSAASLPKAGAGNANASTTNTTLQVAILELQNYRRAYSAEDLSALKELINRARQRYEKAVKTLSKDTLDPSSSYDITLLNLTDTDWVSAQAAIQVTSNRILSQGVPRGIPNQLLAAAIEAQLDAEVPPEALGITTRILMNTIKPNLVEDPEQTKLQAEQAAQAVKDVVVEIRKDEVIVEAGEPITQADFVLLDYFGMSQRRVNWMGLSGFATLVGGGIIIFLLVERRFHPELRCRDHLLVLLLALTVPLVVSLNLPASNLPLIGLLIGSFYGSALGGTLVGLLSLAVPIGMEVAWTTLIPSAVGGVLGAVVAGRSRSREELALLGGVVGITQGAVYLILTLIASTATTTIWYLVLTGAALHCVMGIAWSVMALGVSPYLEHLFDLITPMRLAELSSPNRPLLKRLASEAPGTFQHTLFVATLAEAAARALGCNVELVRAGTLYHDIGKMSDPLGFIENQMGGPNKHDAINDPWQSAALIKKHVTEGVALARKYRLPTAVKAFIPEHQGTMAIAYFHHQAQQRAQADPTILVNDDDFRYDGPIPQTRETAIVMLADSCEAALRTLKDATPEEALAMVNRIFRARWQDNQLAECGLSRAEMTQIAEIFVQVWLQFNHQRVAYPKAIAPAS